MTNMSTLQLSRYASDSIHRLQHSLSLSHWDVMLLGTGVCVPLLDPANIARRRILVLDFIPLEVLRVYAGM